MNASTKQSKSLHLPAQQHTTLTIMCEFQALLPLSVQEQSVTPNSTPVICHFKTCTAFVNQIKTLTWPTFNSVGTFFYRNNAVAIVYYAINLAQHV